MCVLRSGREGRTYQQVISPRNAWRTYQPLIVTQQTCLLCDTTDVPPPGFVAQEVGGDCPHLQRPKPGLVSQEGGWTYPLPSHTTKPQRCVANIALDHQL